LLAGDKKKQNVAEKRRKATMVFCTHNWDPREKGKKGTGVVRAGPKISAADKEKMLAGGTSPPPGQKEGARHSKPKKAHHGVNWGNKKLSKPKN